MSRVSGVRIRCTLGKAVHKMLQIVKKKTLKITQKVAQKLLKKYKSYSKVAPKS